MSGAHWFVVQEFKLDSYPTDVHITADCIHTGAWWGSTKKYQVKFESLQVGGESPFLPRLLILPTLDSYDRLRQVSTHSVSSDDTCFFIL